MLSSCSVPVSVHTQLLIPFRTASRLGNRSIPCQLLLPDSQLPTPPSLALRCLLVAPDRSWHWSHRELQSACVCYRLPPARCSQHASLVCSSSISSRDLSVILVHLRSRSPAPRFDHISPAVASAPLSSLSALQRSVT